MSRRLGIAVVCIAGLAAAAVAGTLRPAIPQLCAAGGDTPPLAGRLLVASQSGFASIVDLASGGVTRIPLRVEPHGAAVSPDGRWGVIPDYGELRGTQLDGNVLYVIDMAAGRVARTIVTGEHRAVHDVEFVPGSNDRVVVTAQRNQEVIEVDLVRGSVTGVLETRGVSSHALAIGGDGRTIFTANEEEHHISRLDLPSRRFVAHLDIGANPMGIALRPDGGEVWVGTRDGDALKVVDVARGSVVATLEGYSNADEIEFTPDGRFVLVSPLSGKALHVIDAATRQSVGSVALTRPHMIDVAPDGKVAFVTVGRDDVVSAIDIGRRCEIARHPVPGQADGVAWGPSGAKAP